MSTHTSLKGFSHIGQTLITTQLEINIEQYLNWALLSKGNFENVTIPSSGTYGGNKHVLRLAEKKGYNAGQVWQGYRDNWVWESGIEYPYQPIAISGINIGSTFYPVSTTGTYSYNIDYVRGEVVFNTAIPTTSVVTCEYSTRWVKVEAVDKSEWFQEVFSRADRVDSVYVNQYGSGDLSAERDRSILLPVVIVEVAPRAYFPKGIQLGGGHWLAQEVHFYVFATSKWERNQIHDFLFLQHDKTIDMFDVDAVDAAGAWLTNNGIGANTKTYPDWVAATGDGGYSYRNKNIRFTGMNSQEMDRPQKGLWTASVGALLEVNMDEI